MTPTTERPEGADGTKAMVPRATHEGLGLPDLVASMSPERARSDQASDRIDSAIVLVLTVVIALVALTGLGSGSTTLEKGAPAPVMRAEEASSGPASS